MRVSSSFGKEDNVPFTPQGKIGDGWCRGAPGLGGKAKCADVSVDHTRSTEMWPVGGDSAGVGREMQSGPVLFLKGSSMEE